MEFGTMSVLVDGTFKSPLVWVSFVLTTLAFLGGALFLVWSLTRSTRFLFTRVAVGAGAALLFILSSPDLFERTANVVASIGASNSFHLCLAPTRLFLRDFAPGIIAVVAATFAWHRTASRGAVKGNAAGPGQVD